jgi:hypothetical protein
MNLPELTLGVSSFSSSLRELPPPREEENFIRGLTPAVLSFEK